MGLIKALTNATSTALGDQFKEFVNCPTIDRNVIIQRGVVTHGEGNYNPSEGILSNGSTIVVPQGMAMMLIDNGEIKGYNAHENLIKENEIYQKLYQKELMKN
jgi:membrane protease subunit (stomatin/prohibitin family)